MNKRHQIICAAYLILLKNNKVLLLKRANTGYMDGYFSLPAGHVDDAESVRQALIREAKEEIGITLLEDGLNLGHILHRNQTKSNEARLDFFFTTNNWQGEIKNMEPNKCSGLEWFNIKHLPNETIPYIKIAIENLHKKTIYDELYWN